MLKVNTCYKHDLNTEVFLRIQDLYLEDENLAIYEIEWYNISGYFIGLDRIKIKHEDKHRWREHKHEQQR